ncbi:MAG: hypothetical protein WBJ41_19015 [Chromatiaceae bacterium]
MKAHPDPDDPGTTRDPGLSALYRRGAIQEPPAELDRRILGLARAAIAPPPRPWRLRLPWRPRWLAIPLSAVAGLLLALGLAWRMVELPPEVGLTQQPPRSGLVRPAPGPETTYESAADAVDAAPPAMSARPSAPAAVSQSREFREAAKAENAIEPLPTEALDTLQAIRQLVLQGDREAAIEQLAAFRRAHPHYPLPPDLARLANTE